MIYIQNNEYLMPDNSLTSITLNGQETNAGEYAGKIVPSAAAIGNATANYEITYAAGKLTITKAALTITAKDQTYEYNGAAQGENNATYTDASKVTVTGLKGTDALTSITLNGQETNAGEYAGKIVPSAAAIGNATANYEISYAAGKLTITPLAAEVTVTITGATDTKEYDGNEHTVTGYTVEISNELYTENDFTFTPAEGAATDEDGNIIASRTNVEDGEDKDGKTEMGMTSDNFQNVSGNFSNIRFVVHDGSITITKRPITLTSAKDEKVYDGTPLTNDEVTITGDGLAPTDELTFNVTGTQTLVGESPNTFIYTFSKKAEKSTFAKVLSALGILGEADAAASDDPESKAIAANYEITEVEGILKVTDEGADEDLIVTKTHADEEGNVQTYQAGDTIEFTITVTNIYDAVKDITIVEQEGVTITGESEFTDVEPGAVVTTTAEYTVTEEDAKSGTFTNKVQAIFDGEATYSNEDEVDTFAHMTVTKEVTNKPADGKVFRTGETIKYEITVTNDGTQTMTDIKVKDELTGDEWTIDSLDAGKSKTFKAEYTVTEKDAVAGSVTNVAAATGTDPDGDETPGVPGEVKTETDKAIDTTPKTGDDTPITEYSLMLGASLALLLMVLFRRKKERA